MSEKSFCPSERRAGQLTSEVINGYTLYGYDAAGQVTSENHVTGYPAFTATYTYDRNGNRLSKSVGGQTDTYTYQANHYNGQVHTDRLASVSGGIVGSKAFGYDALGSVRSITTNGSTLYLSTDYEDRVTRFDFGTGPGRGTVWATEAYNGLGARFFRHDAAGQDHSAQYDGASPGAALLYDSAGGSVYTPGVAQTVKGLTLYTNVDALGSVHDAQGSSLTGFGYACYTLVRQSCGYGRHDDSHHRTHPGRRKTTP